MSLEASWCFYHKTSGKTLLGLTEDEAKAVVMTIGLEDPEWLVWTSPWEVWKRVDQAYELHESLNRVLAVQPPALSNEEGELLSDASDGPQGLDAGALASGGGAEDILQLENVSFDLTGSGQFVVRKSRRFPKRYEISIHLNDEVFRTHSVDIGVGGVKVEDKLPSWVSGYFKVRIKKPTAKQIIELSACLVEGDGPPDRYRFSILPLQNQNDETNLENWLAA